MLGGCKALITFRLCCHFELSETKIVYICQWSTLREMSTIEYVFVALLLSVLKMFSFRRASFVQMSLSVRLDNPNDSVLLDV